MCAFSEEDPCVPGGVSCTPDGADFSMEGEALKLIVLPNIFLSALVIMLLLWG